MNRRGFVATLLSLPALLFFRPKKHEGHIIVKKCLACREVVTIDTGCGKCRKVCLDDHRTRHWLYNFYYKGRRFQNTNTVFYSLRSDGFRYLATDPEVHTVEDWTLCERCWADIQWWT
jgi:ferredoxin